MLNAVFPGGSQPKSNCYLLFINPAGDRAGTIIVLEVDTRELTLSPDPVAGLFELVFSPDSRHLAGAGPGRFASLWDADTGRLLRRFHGSFGPPLSVSFVNDGTQLRVLGIGGFGRGYVLDPLDLVGIARDEKTRDLTEFECQQYLGRACEG